MKKRLAPLVGVWITALAAIAPIGAMAECVDVDGMPIKTPECLAAIDAPPPSASSSEPQLSGMSLSESETSPSLSSASTMSAGAMALTSIPTAPNLAGGVAGSLKGQAGVSSSGSATYSIPIPIPVGTAGVVPSISVNYDSQGREGVLGIGWSVGGLSTIHRCAQTHAVDGKSGRIALDAGDRYCLDGQRLILVSGTYGASGVYRTEIDTISRITSSGSNPTVGPTSWTVETRAGQIHTYGGTGDSFVEAQGSTKPLLWAVNRIEDRKGNFYTFQYTENNAEGEHLPVSIRYTGNGSSLVPYNAVRFEYAVGTRPDPIVRFIADTKTSIVKRIARITTWVDTAADGTGGTKVSEFRFTYVLSPSSKRSIVSAISHCDGAGACLPATTFVAQAHTTAHRNFTAAGSGVWNGPVVNWEPGTWPSTLNLLNRILLVDLNGDGRTDLLKSFENGNWHACLSTGAAFDCQVWAGPTDSMNSAEDIIAGDFNGDGKTDILSPNGVPWEVCLSTGSSFTCGNWSGQSGATPLSPIGFSGSYVARDQDGDGRDDVVVRTGVYASNTTCMSTGANFSCGPFDGQGMFDPYMLNYFEPDYQCHIGVARWQPFAGDFNGDGRIDSLLTDYLDPYCARWWITSPNNSFSLCLTGDNGNSCAPAVTNLGEDQGYAIAPGSMIGDFNGDGLQDFVLRLLNNYTTTKVCLSKGTTLDCQDFLPGNTTDANVGHIADFDGDGTPENLSYDGATGAGRLCRIDFGSYACEDWATPVVQSNNFGPYYGDFDGDGKTDLAFYSETAKKWTVQLANGPVPDLLASVTNGLGHVTTFVYQPLTKNSVYVTDSGTANAATYPLREVSGGRQVVSQIDLDNGIGGATSTAYRYGGSKQDLQRGTSASFRWMESTDSVTHVASRIEYAQNFPYAGLVQRQIETHTNGVELKRIENTLSALTNTATPADATQQIRYPFVSAVTETEKELNNGTVVRTSAMSIPLPSGMDTYGNTKSLTKAFSAAGETWTTTTTTGYSNASSSWLVGRPTSITLTKATTGVAVPASATRVFSMNYVPSTNLLSRLTIEPGDATLEVQTQFGLDEFGNIKTKTQTWTDPLTSVVRSRVIEDNTYDSRGRYVELAKNALLHSESRVNDPRTGQLLSLTGPNGLTTTWQYDGWGRKTREDRTDGTATTWDYRACVDTCVNSAVQVFISQAWSGATQISVPTEEFLDRLNRKVLTRSWSFDGTETRIERQHDANARLLRVTRPYAVGGTPVWTNLTHDDLGRRTSVVEPTGTGGTQTYTFAYNGRTTTSTNPKSQIRIVERNAIGSLRNVTDAKGYTTSYQVDPHGNLTRTVDPKGNRMTVGYDKLGRKTSLNDPDLGAWSYLVDPLGQTYRQTDAKAQVTTYAYDDLGRMTRRLEPDLDSRWVFDSSVYGVGKLAEAYTLTGGGVKDYRRVHRYDNKSRPSSTTLSLDWDYTTTYTYDSYGRPATQAHSRNAVGGTGGPANSFSWTYNALGYQASLSSLRHNGVIKVEWEVRAQDVEQRVTQEALGNGLLSNRAFNAYNGRLESLSTGADIGSTTANSANIQNDIYQYDALGNVELRSQLAATGGAFVQEGFTYDELNRMATSQVAGLTLKNYTYDEIGNLLTKTGVGSYTYPASGTSSVRPHAVASIAGTVNGVVNPSFTYDANGNLLTGIGRSTTPTSFNLPASITYVRATPSASTTTDAFVYGPEHQRARQTVTVTSGTAPVSSSTTIYGDGIEKESYAAETKIRTYMPMGLGFLEETLPSASPLPSATALVVPRYFRKDHLGSVNVVLGSAGGVVQRLAFDVWGKRRSASGADDTSGSLVGATDETGYTGHEHLDAVALIHMNGRVYDPTVGRFMQSDPTVPDASDLQQFNRYSYVLNNPLAFVDPSGYSAMAQRSGADPDMMKDPQNPSPEQAKEQAERIAGQPNGLTNVAVRLPDVEITGKKTNAGSAARILRGGGLPPNWEPFLEKVGPIVIRRAPGILSRAVTGAVLGPVGAIITIYVVVDGIVEVCRAVSVDGESDEGAIEANSPEIKPSDVAGKTPGEIDQLATGAGLKPKGPDPQNGKGAYVDPVTGEQRVLVHGDHAHVNDAAGNRLDIKGNVVPSNSPAAHLPIKSGS